MTDSLTHDLGTIRFGMSGDGTMVEIDVVERGLACGCVCPSCGGRLVAKKGDVIAHHFAHEADASCATAVETTLHRLAKQIVAEAGGIWVAEVSASVAGLSKVAHPSAWVGLDIVELEVWKAGIRPDIIGRKGKRELAIEIFVTHAVDDEKSEFIRQRGIACLEVDLSGVARSATYAEIKASVLRAAPRKWIFNAKLEKLISDLALEAKFRKEKAEAERRDAEAREQAKKEEIARRRRDAELRMHRIRTLQNIQKLEHDAALICKLAGISVTQFMDMKLPPSLGECSPMELVEDCPELFGQLLRTIWAWNNAIRTAELPFPSPGTDDDLGLPCLAALRDAAEERRRIHDEKMRAAADQQRQDEAAREAAKLEEFKAHIEQQARAILGPDKADRWMDNIHKLKSMPRHVGAYYAELDHAATENKRGQGNREILMQKAIRHFRSEERARLWVNSVNPKLGRRRPTEVCVDTNGLELCLGALK